MSENARLLDGVTLRADVLAALAELHARPVAAAMVGGWRAGRSTYRVTLADGRVVKARQLRSRTRTQRAAALTAAIGNAQLPPPLVVVGGVTVETWVDGTPLAAESVTGAHVDAAADLIGRLHSETRLPGQRFHRLQGVTAVGRRVGRQTADLVASGVLSEAERRRLVDLARNGLPERAARGVTHGDLRPENLIITESGELISIDNEAVCIDFFDYDLARAWCRWPMSNTVWSRFLHRYARWGRQGPETEPELAWRTVAAVKGAHRWHRAVGASTTAPLDALRRVVDEVP